MNRPALLSVTCIISYILCGVFLLLYALAVTAMGIVESASSELTPAMQKLAAMEDGGGSSSSVSNQMVWIYVIVGIVAVLFNLIGTTKMWKMKKNGFAIYFIGAAIGSGASVYVNGLNGSVPTLVIYGVLLFMFLLTSKTVQPTAE